MQIYVRHVDGWLFNLTAYVHLNRIVGCEVPDKIKNVKGRGNKVFSGSIAYRCYLSSARFCAERRFKFHRNIKFVPTTLLTFISMSKHCLLPPSLFDSTYS